MAEFSIVTLPTPAPDHNTLLEYSSRLKELRLKSLKQDPDSFISNYASECDKPQEFWLDRLSESGVTHLVVVRRDPNATKLGNDSSLLDGQWVGFAVLTTPDGDPSEDIAHDPPEYNLMALYIDSDFRGQGLGKRLVQASIDTIRSHRAANGRASAACLITVRHGNDQALALYQKMGFSIIEPNDQIEKDGRIYPSTVLRLYV
ncbi:hypothetical protein HRR83_008926 [Exophiala dermatitidis]|uniref:N-acetyltransferase domain-containing protein n=2 Tax=Exophiala dermatitidis TaxID=5970 RepID=H6BTR9_EXODN|nr:uncharacterized protein HMPREF1120_03630 [Exophiala dermatitidis NIH/UT8656]KAJ4504252.1 hypothetical protein HRR73_008808 [Exophiala dermatitidis]EHY55496.1 hypothetical protein HMPREF1120_03630 [Exophiala dermatitidis NIH/UT8656]KAJ4504633.1 hypothetical protein HRR74_008899 [Exophiala dermatitidis]KAJ4533510.1 hypothetical protein HRR77_008488 [Exophiala dermatitidis]KAJ4540393.1 hypothetical protein HRR76_003793 [Exophiala dermatitidis]